MPNIGWFELLILMVLAIVVVGPKDLPRLMRTLGQWTGKARAMAREFQDSFEEMGREADIEDLHKEFDDIKTQTISAVTEQPFQVADDASSEDGDQEEPPERDAGEGRP